MVKYTDLALNLRVPKKKESVLPLLGKTEKNEILQILVSGDPKSLDDLHSLTRIPIQEIQQKLFELELTGQIKRRGAFFVLS
jgi:predicted Rossmann fold nucleotide-binding protein DprA/Smf involved in DNA uptake